MDDFVKLFGLAVFGEISTEEFLIRCGMSPEEAEQMVDEVNEDMGYSRDDHGEPVEDNDLR